MTAPEPPQADPRETSETADGDVSYLRWSRATLLVLSITATVLVLVAWYLPDVDYAVRVTLLLMTVGCWAWFLRISTSYFTHRPSRQPAPATPIDIDPDDYREWESSLTTAQTETLFGLLGRPQEMTRRITEVIEPSLDALDVLKVVTLDIGVSGRLLIPVYEQLRGQLVNKLSIKISDGDRLSTLTQRETILVLSVMFDRQIDLLSPKNPRAIKRAPADRATVSAIIGQILSSTSPATATDALSRVVSPDGELGPELNRLAKDPAQVAVLLRALLRVTDRYPLLVAVDIPAPSSAQSGPVALRRDPLRIEVRRVQELERPKSGLLVSWFYRTLGVFPPRINYLLREADLAQSYHLQAVAPETLLFYEIDVKPLFRFRDREAPELLADGENRSSHELSRLGHYYLRGAQNLTLFRAEISFKEGRPSSVTQALVWSGLLSLLIFIERTSGNEDVFFLSLLPVLLTGLSTGSIWQGMAEARTTIFGGRIASRLSALLNILLAVSAAALTALGEGGDETVAAIFAWMWVVVQVLNGLNTLTMAVYATVDRGVENRLAASPEWGGSPNPDAKDV